MQNKNAVCRKQFSEVVSVAIHSFLLKKEKEKFSESESHIPHSERKSCFQLFSQALRLPLIIYKPETSILPIQAVYAK